MDINEVNTISMAVQSGLSTGEVLNLLTEEGFRPSVDDDGDIRFKYEGRIYYVRFEPKDDNFVRLCAINIAPDLKSLELAYRCCNQVNLDIKVAKAFCVERNGSPVVWVSAECRYDSVYEFAQQLIGLLGGIRAGVNHFRETLERYESENTEQSPKGSGFLN